MKSDLFFGVFGAFPLKKTSKITFQSEVVIFVFAKFFGKIDFLDVTSQLHIRVVIVAPNKVLIARVVGDT